jgi:hypothetical protein
MPEDAYVKVQKQMMTTPKDQMMAKVMELAEMCTCPSCPTYNEYAKNSVEGLFCAMGYSFLYQGNERMYLSFLSCCKNAGAYPSVLLHYGK